MLLADEFFLITVDDRTGRPRLAPKTTGLGLAAALLGELTMFGKITVQDDRLFIVDRSPPHDALAHTTLDHLVAEPHHRLVRTWLSFLSHTAYESVAQRLFRAGHVRRETTRRLLRAQVVYVPVDGNAAAWPWARLSTRLRAGAHLDYPDVFLAGLATATGLERQLLDGGGVEAARYLADLVAALPPPLHALVAHTHAAVGDAVLSHRT